MMTATTPSQASNFQPASAERPSQVKIWFQAMRFFSFTASAAPIIVGSALAAVDRSFDLLLFLAMVIASVACHGGANLANDYFDHLKGVDNDESLGPSKVIQLGYLTPRQVLRGMIVAFGVATVLGLAVVFSTGWEILVVALLSLGAAVLYTGGPKPLGYIALGEFVVFLFMGNVMVCGAYYVMTGRLTTEAVVLSLPVAMLVAAILHINNIRDMEPDGLAGKRTLANVLGRTWANWEYAIFVYGVYPAIAALVAIDIDLWPVLMAFITLPAAIALVRLVFSDSGPMELNLGVRKTAGLHLQVGLLLTAGLLVATTIDRVF